MNARIGFVGAGSVATRHARALLGFPDVEVAAVCDTRAEAAQALAELGDAAAYATHEDMLATEPLDGLYICVPPFAHGPPEHAAIDAGVPFFVEKPLAIDLATARGVAERVADRDLTTAAGYHWRYLDTVERASKLLEDNPARLVIGYWLDKVPPPTWWVRRDRSGGQTIEQTTHVLDVVRTLVGEAAEVYAIASRSPRPAFPDSDVEEVSSATIRFRSGAVGSVSSTCLLNAKHRAGVELFAEGMTIELTEADMAVGLGDGLDRRQAREDAKTRADRDFVDALLGRENRIRAPYADALETHRLACALARSAEEGRPMELEEAAHA